ncbi:Ni/Fe hydrogenase subunit alpha [Desulfonatronovibrio hydrogenovorans]|uniref:Ni/Fe hydrogenase subunit alpha n=1 Tax=Desulfonatronovibrio hydrogenovorans TaxID=53245 RepID=UPI0009FC203D|nr:Ni/Fe hydrogenase subunit alpha [Desulfonatronovibrio hydrogenovorans]
MTKAAAKEKKEKKSGSPAAAGPRKLEVKHLTRVEGHGNIIVKLDAKNHVQDCRWEIVEAPRFFEAMVQGRPYEDIHHIVSRICGICSIGHQLCSIQATEDAFGFNASEQTLELRKLALHAENLQSHLLHIGYLVLPDLLGVDSVLPLAQTHREELLNLVACRRVANEFSRLICGRTTHPQRLIPGGMEKIPTRAELQELQSKLEGSLSRMDRIVDLFAALADKWPDFKRPTEYVALVSPSEYALYSGEIGSSSDINRPASLYRQVTNEYCVPQSTAKWAKNTGESYMVGALARFNLNHRLLKPGARQAAQKLGLKAPEHNPYLNTVAQLVECVHSTEDSLEIIAGLLARGLKHETPPTIRVKAGKGVGAVEVPRGILIHSYEYSDEGRIISADCVIPTNQNHGNIQMDMDALKPMLSGLEPEAIELKLSMLVRGYDPCISCSTHLLDVSGTPARKLVKFVRV